jgi:hypothetical protein
MRSCQTTLSPLFRSLAVLTLAVFVAAELMCFVHCHFGGGHADSAEPSCHQTVAAEGDHSEDGPSSPARSSMTSCFTLQNLLTSSGLTLIVPEFPALYTLTPAALDAIAVELTASISRPARHCDWVFTPEVCTGPANRTLAPPFLS